MKIKICILTSVHPIYDTRIFIKQSQSLKKAGYSVTLIGQHKIKEVIEGINIIPLSTPKNRFERIFKLTFKLFKKSLKVDADIYHFHDPELIPIGLLLKLKGKKVIYDVHEDVSKQILSKTWIPKPFRKITSTLVKGIEKIADKFLDSIISATPTIDNKFSNNNSIVVQNFPILNELVSINRNNNKNIVTYIGGISASRGIKEMVEAVGLLPKKYNTKFLLAGKFSTKKLKEECKKIDGWRKVDFQGWIGRRKMMKILSNSKAGLVLFKPGPNHIKSQPNKMFEYMSASLAVIASDFPLWQKIIAGNKCGINVDPEKPEEIAEAIKYLFDHPEEAKKMGMNARKAVEKKYNWSLEEKKLLNLYKKLLLE